MPSSVVFPIPKAGRLRIFLANFKKKDRLFEAIRATSGQICQFSSTIRFPAASLMGLSRKAPEGASLKKNLPFSKTNSPRRFTAQLTGIFFSQGGTAMELFPLWGVREFTSDPPGGGGGGGE